MRHAVSRAAGDNFEGVIEMGLDIYLYRYENFERTKKLEYDYNRFSEEAWHFGGTKYEDLTQLQKDEANAKVEAKALEMGLDKYGEDAETRKSIELASVRFPEHLFKIGYFRSSYNDGGINRILKNMVGTDLYGLFPSRGDEYTFQPDWAQSKALAQQVLGKFRTKIAEDGPYRVMKASYNEFRGHPNKDPIKDEASALACFLETARKYKTDSLGSFSNSQGEFFLKEPLKVVGIIEGVNRRYFVDESLPCSYVIYKDEDGFRWYIDALEIVLETCEWVLAQPDKDKFWLHWSG